MPISKIILSKGGNLFCPECLGTVTVCDSCKTKKFDKNVLVICKDEHHFCIECVEKLIIKL